MKAFLAAASALALLCLAPAAAPQTQRAGCDAPAEQTFEAIRLEARELAGREPAVIAQPVFEVVVENKVSFLRYSMGAATPELFEGAGPFRLAFEQQVRVEALRRLYEVEVPRETFWQPSLLLLEQLVRDTVRDVQTAPDEAQLRQRLGRRQALFDAQLGLLRDLIETYARRNDYTPRSLDKKGEGPKPYRVRVVVDPGNGTVRVMSAGAYKLCASGLRACHPDKEQWEWTELRQHEADLIGDYRYQARWPGGVVREGTFSVTNNSPVEFKKP